MPRTANKERLTFRENNCNYRRIVLSLIFLFSWGQSKNHHTKCWITRLEWHWLVRVELGKQQLLKNLRKMLQTNKEDITQDVYSWGKNNTSSVFGHEV